MKSALTLFLKIGKASGGLVLFAFGTYLTVQADIGLSPWDVFAMGLSRRLPFSFGLATIGISIVMLLLDLLLREKIGIGTVLDALIVGASFDVIDRLHLIPCCHTLWGGLILMTVGLFIMAFAQFVYMSAAIGCGPRDSFLVAVGRRMKRVPIGAVSIGIEAVVLLFGWLLGGPVGIGTAYAVAGVGITMQIVFRLVRFEPRHVIHEGFADSAARFDGRSAG